MARGGGRSGGGSSGTSGRSSGGSSRSSGGRVASGSSRSSSSTSSSGGGRSGSSTSSSGGGRSGSSTSSSGRGGRTSSSSSSKSSKPSSGGGSFFGRGGGGGTSSSSYGGSRGQSSSSSRPSSPPPASASGGSNGGPRHTGPGFFGGGHHYRPYRPRRRRWFRRNYYDDGRYYDNGAGYGAGYGPGYGPGPGQPPAGGQGCMTGCLLYVFGAFAFTIVLLIVFSGAFLGKKEDGQGNGDSAVVQGESVGENGSDTAGTENLPPVIMTYETEYFTDELGWLSDVESVKQAMQYFAEQTGVKPYLFITDYVNETYYPTEEDFDIFAGELYDALFDDEDHLLVIYHEYESTVYSLWYVKGMNADAYLGDAEMDILLDTFDEYYYSDLSDDEYFGNVFTDAAEKIAGGG